MFASSLAGKSILILGAGEMRGSLAVLLRQNGCMVVETEYPEQAGASLQRWPVDLMVLEPNAVGGLDGLELLYRLEQLRLPVLWLIESDEPPHLLNGQFNGAFHYLPRTVHPLEVLATVLVLVSEETHKKLARKTADMPTSKAMALLVRTLQRQAGLHCTRAIAQDLQALSHLLNDYYTFLGHKAAQSEAMRITLADVNITRTRTMDMIEQLLSCLQQSETCNICDVVEDVSAVLHKLMGESIDLSIHQPTLPCWIEAKRGLLENLLLRLGLQVRDHLPENGWCSLSIAEVERHEAEDVPPMDSATGQYVRLMVRFGAASPPLAWDDGRLAALAQQCGGCLRARVESQGEQVLTLYFRQAPEPQPQPDVIV